MLPIRSFSYFVVTTIAMAATAKAADFQSLCARLPDDANALVLVDVEKIMKSPIALRDATRPAPIPPANRQFAVRWLRGHGAVGGSQLSEYLQQAVAQAGGAGAFVMVLDLQDSFDVNRIRARLEGGAFECLDNAKA